MRTLVREDIGLDEIKKREAEEKRKLIGDRIRAIRLVREGNYRYQEISKILGKKDPNYTLRWIKRFNVEGFEGLETKPGQGQKPLLNDLEKKQLEQWLIEPEKHGINVWTAPRLQEKIKEEFSKHPSEQCIYDTLRQMGFKHRKARPIPSKADLEELEDFKKSAQEREGNKRAIWR